jgi:hypothetical protein
LLIGNGLACQKTDTGPPYQIALLHACVVPPYVHMGAMVPPAACALAANTPDMATPTSISHRLMPTTHRSAA